MNFILDLMYDFDAVCGQVQHSGY